MYYYLEKFYVFSDFEILKGKSGKFTAFSKTETSKHPITNFSVKLL
jgi:hypothetical protein